MRAVSYLVSLSLCVVLASAFKHGGPGGGPQGQFRAGGPPGKGARPQGGPGARQNADAGFGYNDCTSDSPRQCFESLTANGISPPTGDITQYLQDNCNDIQGIIKANSFDDQCCSIYCKCEEVMQGATNVCGGTRRQQPQPGAGGNGDDDSEDCTDYGDGTGTEPGAGTGANRLFGNRQGNAQVGGFGKQPRQGGRGNNQRGGGNNQRFAGNNQRGGGW